MREPSAQEGLLGSICVALCALTVLCALSTIYTTDQLLVEGHGFGFNDQAGYITTARWLADTGELRSHLVYPAYVEEPNWRLYMPGTYYALATAYQLFGDGPMVWRAPALLSFIIAAVGIFLIGRRFFGAPSGGLAAAIFIALPMNGLFAFTAMPQMLFIAWCVLSFCVFAHLPVRSRALWIPFLLIPPFLIRETGALLVIPMALLSIQEGRFRPWANAAIAVLGSLCTLSLVMAIQIASGKGSLPLTWPLVGQFNYANAFPPPLAPSAWEWTSKIFWNVIRNFQIIGNSVTERWQAVEPVLWLIALTAIGLLNAKRKLAIGTALLVITVFGMLFTLYDWNYYRGVRSTLFTFPLAAIAASPVLIGWFVHARERISEGPFRKFKVLLPWTIAALVVLWSGRISLDMADATSSDYGARAIERLERIDIDRDKLLVSPFEISLDYAVAHYPLRWSFVPANSRTLRLLDSEHEIGTFIAHYEQMSIRFWNTLTGMGFALEERFSFEAPTGKRVYWVFQRETPEP